MTQFHMFFTCERTNKIFVRVDSGHELRFNNCYMNQSIKLWISSQFRRAFRSVAQVVRNAGSRDDTTLLHSPFQSCDPSPASSERVKPESQISCANSEWYFGAAKIKHDTGNFNNCLRLVQSSLQIAHESLHLTDHWNIKITIWLLPIILHSKFLFTIFHWVVNCRFVK